MHIDHLVIIAEHRRAGCATLLIEHVKDQARKQNITRLGIDFWSFNDIARRCFENAGFNIERHHMSVDL